MVDLTKMNVILVAMDKDDAARLRRGLQQMLDFIVVREHVAKTAALEILRTPPADSLLLDEDLLRQVVADLEAAERTDLLASFEGVKQEAAALAGQVLGTADA